jgi:hypothetical protein
MTISIKVVANKKITSSRENNQMGGLHQVLYTFLKVVNNNKEDN